MESKIITISEIASGEIILKRDEKLTVVGVISDPVAAKQILKFKLQGEGAELKCFLITVGKSGQQNFETAVEHLARHTSAEMIIKSVQLDGAALDYTGFIVIPKSGEETRSFLRHDVLLLSENASARTIPALEIEAEDVKASHSASVGKLDEEEIFYLETRGFDQKVSEKMLIKAFLEEVLEKFAENEMVEELRNNLYADLKI